MGVMVATWHEQNMYNYTAEYGSVHYLEQCSLQPRPAALSLSLAAAASCVACAVKRLVRNVRLTRYKVSLSKVRE